MDVIGPPGIGMVAPGIGARFDRNEAVATLGIGEDAAGAVEIGIERRVVLVAVDLVAAGGIGLPDLDHGVRDGAAVLVDDAPGDDDALAHRRATVALREI